jgi:hypothetical protein
VRSVGFRWMAQVVFSRARWVAEGFDLTPLGTTSTMIGMKFRSLRLVATLLLLLIACSTPSNSSFPPAAMLPDGLQINRSGLWATKVFATFPTFVDEAPSSPPGLALEPTTLHGSQDGVTPNPILSDCATMVFNQDGTVKTTAFEPCPSPERNPLGFVWWLLQALWRN